MRVKYLVSFLLMVLIGVSVAGQVLTLKEAVQTALNNYNSIKAKANYLKSSQATAKQAAAEYFPDFSVGAQQAWGNANGQFGPVYPTRSLSAGSSGPVSSSQSWTSTFGALYVANVNWDFFQFGRMKERTKVAEAEVTQQAYDLEQEKFQHEVRVAGAYLNLLAAQRLRISEQRNLERATALRNVVVTRAKNGLNPGVDSSQANAEVSSAKISLTNAIDYELEQANQLSQLMGIPSQQFMLDTFFINRIPNAYNVPSTLKEDVHPVLKFYQSRINVSKEQEKYFDRAKYPVFTLFGVFQGRGSGFHYDYSPTNPDAYTHNYWTGVNPTRSNYLLGVGMTWNITSTLRVRQQVLAQQWTSEGLRNEYDLVDQQIKGQLALADQKMQTAIANYTEAPVQVKAASDAYLQKSVLYRNGLATIVDLSQALYILNRAETDRDISVNNIWQALLMKAAASGDFSMFINEF
jgi:outer membrane protein TolC